MRAFMHDFRVKFPVGTDYPSEDRDIPQTMNLSQMQGTPTWIIIDKKGNLKLQAFGQINDILLGAEIARYALKRLGSDANIYNV